MATVTRDPNGVYVDAPLFTAQIPDLVAGAAIAAGMPCYIKGADGFAYQSDGTALNEAAKFDGFSAKAAAQGQPITLLTIGQRIHYSASGVLTPGADLFLDAGGGLNTVATTGGTRAIARAINDTDIRVTKASDQA
jgi:hypothetical protein